MTDAQRKGLVDDLNRNIGLLRQLAKLEDSKIGPSDLRSLAQCMLALCVSVRTIIQVQGLQMVPSDNPVFPHNEDSVL